MDVTLDLEDPLLQCLVFLTKYYEKPYSANTLSAGLPLVDGRLTLGLFDRAANRANLDAKVVRRELSAIANVLLPCVLAFDDGRYGVLHEIKDGQARISWAELLASEDWQPLEVLQETYTGVCVLVKKRFVFDARANSTLTTKEEHWFWSTIKRSRSIYRDALIAALFINLFALASPLFVMNVYDRVVPNLALDTLWVLAGGVVIITIFDFLLKEVRAVLLDSAAKKSDVLLSAKLFAKVLNISMAARPKSVGAFARNVQEFESIREFITSATLSAFIDIPFSILILVVIGFVAGPLIAVPLAVIVIMASYSWWVKGKIRYQIDQGGRLSSAKNAQLIETLGGVEALKLAGAESQFQRRWEELAGELARWNMEVRRLSTSVGAFCQLMMQLCTVCLIVFGVYLIMAGNLSMGGLIACVMLTGRAIAPFSQAALLATRFNQTESALNGLNEIMALPEEDFDRYLHRPSIDGNILLEKVTFGYPDAKQPALNNVSFSIKKGEKVAIIGRIGSGKSTLLRLLMGFYPATEGGIRFDDVDVGQLSPSDIRRQIGAMFQDSPLFFGSIKDNITLGAPHIDQARVQQVADIAGVNHFADTDPEGLDRQVGERGEWLSGGQRQAVVLARTLLFDPATLLLDEPTSHLDNQSEMLLKERLQLLTENKTLVMVTHKISMLSLVDRIIVMDRGNVVADGPKKAVMEALRDGQIKGA